MWQYINDKPVWLKFLKPGIDLITAESVAFQLTAKLSGSFCYIFLRLTDNSLYWIRLL